MRPLARQQADAKLVPAGGRALFIDDGGESSTLTMLCALCVDAEVADDARDRVAALRDDLEQVIPALANEAELHGIRLGRRLAKKERARALRERRTPLRDHERAFIFQHVLHHVIELPGRPVMYTIAHKVAGGRQTGEPRGREVRRITAGLIDWVAEHETVVVRAVIDKGRQFRHNRDGFADAARTSRAAVQCSLEAVASEHHALIQVADLACYAAYQAIRPGEVGRQRFPDNARWYKQALSEIFAEGSDQAGIRHLT